MARGAMHAGHSQRQRTVALTIWQETAIVAFAVMFEGAWQDAPFMRGNHNVKNSGIDDMARNCDCGIYNHV